MIATRDMVAEVLAVKGVWFDGTGGHRRRRQIADAVLEALRNRVANSVDPTATGVEVKVAALDVLRGDWQSEAERPVAGAPATEAAPAEGVVASEAHREALMRTASLAGWAARPDVPGLTPMLADSIALAAAQAVLDRLEEWRRQKQPARSGPWCPVCRQSVPETGMAWTFPPHGGCEGAGRKVRDVDHGFIEGGRVVPEWEYDAARANL